jgi:hypothetical protein
MVHFNEFRRTTTTPEDSRANGSAKASVGLTKRQTRSILSESSADEKFWPFAISYAAKERELKLLGEKPRLKLGMNVIVKKRTSANRKVKGFEPIAQEAKHLGPTEDATEGHYVLLEDGKISKTSRTVPYTEEEEAEQDKDLETAGWKIQEDPDGNRFFLKEATNERSWSHPLRLEEREDEPNQEEQPRRRKRVTGKKRGVDLHIAEEKEDEKEEKRRLLNEKQSPENLYVKMLITQQNEDEEENEDELSKTITSK